MKAALSQCLSDTGHLIVMLLCRRLRGSIFVEAILSVRIRCLIYIWVSFFKLLSSINCCCS